MKKITAILVVAVAFVFLNTNQAEAQHFHRGFGNSWGGSGFNISIGNGPAFGPAFGPVYGGGFHHGWNRNFHSGFGHPGFYRPAPVYRVPVHSGFHYGGFNRGVGIHYGRGFGVGCGW